MMVQTMQMHHPAATTLLCCTPPWMSGLKMLANSFVKAEHVLDGIHDGRFAVLVAI
jgi:hypothetical protein